MPENADNCDYLNSIPTEVLLYIFTFLPGRQLTKNRQVCRRWKNIIDDLTRSDALWRELCWYEFKHLSKIARLKSRVGLNWFNLYRSLALWPRLTYAREIQDEFASASDVDDEIKDIKILNDGIIAVHKLGGIIYYDIETLEPAKRDAITGPYISYDENNDTIICHGSFLHLHVVRTVVTSPLKQALATFDDVATFLLVDRQLYYVTLNNSLYVCSLDHDKISCRFLKQMEESVMGISYSDRHVYILTFERKIYKLFTVDSVLSLVCNLDECNNLLHQLHKYNLLGVIHWPIYFQWLCILKRTIPVGPLRDIISVRPYGETFFVGCKWGVLRIYQSPFVNGELDFYNVEPVKQYNFMERSDCPVLTRCPILQVDVLEAECGHTVVIAMPKKVAVLEFRHSFKRTASAAMLPYSEVQRVKWLKME